jgi:phosphoserine phosphatase
VLNPLAELLTLDFTRANELEIENGVLTGRISGKIVDRLAKRSALIEWASACGLELSQTVAVGDGSNDLDMMQAAGLSVAFNAKPIVREQANLVVSGLDLRELAPVLGLKA